MKMQPLDLGTSMTRSDLRDLQAQLLTTLKQPRKTPQAQRQQKEQEPVHAPYQPKVSEETINTWTSYVKFGVTCVGAMFGLAATKDVYDTSCYNQKMNRQEREEQAETTRCYEETKRREMQNKSYVSSGVLAKRLFFTLYPPMEGESEAETIQRVNEEHEYNFYKAFIEETIKKMEQDQSGQEKKEREGARKM